MLAGLLAWLQQSLEVRSNLFCSTRFPLAELCLLLLQGNNGGKYNVLIDVPYKAFSDDFREYCLLSLQPLQRSNCKTDMN